MPLQKLNIQSKIEEIDLHKVEVLLQEKNTHHQEIHKEKQKTQEVAVDRNKGDGAELLLIKGEGAQEGVNIKAESQFQSHPNYS